MKLFKVIHNKAYNHELNNNVLKYKFADNAPTIERKERKALTTKQYDKFLKLDLMQIPQSGRNPLYYFELYSDYCIFLYEMKTRPADVIRLHNDNITSINGKAYISYIPEKKKNYRKSKSVRNEITETAQRIIDKYKGKSLQGYIFPFAMNEYKWDMNDPKSWNCWNNRKQATEETINKFLKKVAPYIGVSPDDFTLYTFRHSAITHEIKANEKSPAIIAAEAGTSVAMIEKHYFDITA